MAPTDHLHVTTPLRESIPLSKLAGTKVYLKLECSQPTASFKIRGIGNFCKTWVERGCKHFVTSSDSTKAAKELVKNNPEWVYVPPFDDPLIWEGHMSLVREIKDQMASKPGAIALSVGGGGMLCGVIQGLREVGWDDVPVVALETKGAQSLNASLAAGKLVTLPQITSVATTLGVSVVAAETLKLAQEHPTLSVVITDQEAVEAIEKFVVASQFNGPRFTDDAELMGITFLFSAWHFSGLNARFFPPLTDDEKILVEPACGAALAIVYGGKVQKLQAEGKLTAQLDSLVVIVCGGNNITLAQLKHLKAQLGLSKDEQWDDDVEESHIAMALWSSRNKGGHFRASFHHQPYAY
ncbi:L-serine dehydratase/L-threonine deaminase, partial [Ophiophagus hannah]